MKHIFVHAYLAGNVGDDLFIRILCARYPKLQFEVLAEASYKKRFADIPNIQVYSPGDARVQKINQKMEQRGVPDGFRMQLVKRAAAVVYIGGSMFIEPTDASTDFYAFDKSLVDNSRGLYYIGVNFGPYTDEAYRKKYHALFERSRGICFRDRYSYALFQDIPQAAYAPDLVFQYQMPQKSTVKKEVILAPIDLENRGGKFAIAKWQDVYLDFHVRIAKHLIKAGYKICLMPFCISEHDDWMTYRIWERLNEKEKQQTQSILFHGDFGPLFRKFSECEAILGTRFHSIILGFLSKLKVLPIVYNPKTEQMLDDIGYDRRLQLSALAHTSAEEAAALLLTATGPDIAPLASAAEKHFQFMDSQFRNRT